MRNSTHRKWTKASKLALLPVAALAATQSLSAELRDLHLNYLPRTEDEHARIARVTAAPVEFSAPQRFEELPGGAATVRARIDADAFSQPSGNLSFEQELDFKVGNGLFKKISQVKKKPPLYIHNITTMRKMALASQPPSE